MCIYIHTKVYITCYRDILCDVCLYPYKCIYYMYVLRATKKMRVDEEATREEERIKLNAIPNSKCAVTVWRVA